MVCYASLGGSGVVATELARALAGRGHDIHLISSEPPFRWTDNVRGLTFHSVTVPSYPLFGSLLIRCMSWPRPASARASSVATTPLPPSEA